jgi:anhydro-N-acetylmuramic acid kinase
MNLSEIGDKQTRFVVGLMSGTSCDGVDAALVRLKGTGPEMHIKLMEFASIPYPQPLRMRLLAPRMDATEVCALNFELGERMAQAALELLNPAKGNVEEVDLIASSGHTVAHMPPQGSEPYGTLQIGEPSIIAERCGVPVVSDFRTRDMAVGGQGAPLVPYADWVMFHRDDRSTACLNLGGIANLTVVTPEFGDVIAFDTGPCNMAIDGAVRQLTNGARHMDNHGEAAAEGVVIDEFLDYLLDHPFFVKVPPKSTGREDFGAEVYLKDALNGRRDHSYEDLIATVTAAVAFSIVRAYTRFVKPQHDILRLIVSGGGAHNRTLMERLNLGFEGVKVRRSERYQIPCDSREAIAFAILGNETICNTRANVPAATGASKRVVLGKITPA